MSDCDRQTAAYRTAFVAQSREFGGSSKVAPTCRKLAKLFRVTQCVTWVFVFAALVCKVEASFCDPNDPSTCGFGGKCVPVRSIPEISINDFAEERYICECPSAPCYAILPRKPVCGLENGEKKNYYNELCRLMRQCLIQAPIKPVCLGICNEDCRPLEPNIEPCNEAEQSYCNSEGGLCMIHRGTQNPQPFCRCFTSFTGDRCQFKSTVRLRGVGAKTAETINYRLGFYFCIGLLGLMLALQTAYCVVARRRGYSPDNGNCCGGCGAADASADMPKQLPATVSSRSN